MSAAPLHGPSNIELTVVTNAEEVAKIKKLTGIPMKYIDKTRETERREVEDSAKLTLATRVSSGIAGGLAALFVLKAIGFITGVVIAATPFGWAAIAVGVIALVLLAVRHNYMKSHGLKTDTALEAVKGVGIAALAALIVIIVAVALKGGGSGGGGSYAMTSNMADFVQISALVARGAQEPIRVYRDDQISIGGNRINIRGGAPEELAPDRIKELRGLYEKERMKALHSRDRVAVAHFNNLLKELDKMNR